MSTLTMLDRALILAQHELDALNEGNVEAAESHFMDRAEIITNAHKEHDEENSEDYVIKLIALQGYNQLICEVGEKLKDSMRVDILASKKSTHAAKSYMRLSHRQ